MLRLPVVFVVAAVLSGAPLPAAEPYLEFVRGLRDRQMFDAAIEYLDKIESDPQVPAEAKEVIPYEKAVTLLDGAKLIKTVEAQARQIDRAETLLAQFTKQSPEHPKAGLAHAQRGEILLGKARVEVQQARSPQNSDHRRAFQTRAREHVAGARQAHQAAHDQHRTAFGRFPPYIDPETDKEQFEERRAAEINYIKAQLDLAICRYEEAQTWDPGSSEFHAILIAASQEFEAMHRKYRSQVGGLFARLWQGKCFEEMDDLGKALGIYNELLGHPGRSESMRRLQDQATQFRLICLNHDQRKDYLLVVQEADEWLTINKARNRTSVGIGIRWEKARALEAMGTKRNMPENERDAALRQACVEAREISQFAGPYKDVSNAMLQRLEAIVGKESGEPGEKPR